MYVTRHSNVTDMVLTDKLWALYETAYRGMSELVVTREMLFRTEFDQSLADPTNRIWVLWDDSVPVGMSLVATDVGSTRYLSRAYFEHHYPEHVRREAVHYVMWLVVHPAYQARGAMQRITKEGLALEASEGALVVFDAPEVNQPSIDGAFAEMVTRMARLMGSDAPVEHLGTQRYFAVDFAPKSSPAAAPDDAEVRSVSQ